MGARCRFAGAPTCAWSKRMAQIAADTGVSCSGDADQRPTRSNSVTWTPAHPSQRWGPRTRSPQQKQCWAPHVRERWGDWLTERGHIG